MSVRDDDDDDNEDDIDNNDNNNNDNNKDKKSAAKVNQLVKIQVYVIAWLSISSIQLCMKL